MTNEHFSLQSICIIEEQSGLTLEDLCRACATDAQSAREDILALVEEGVLDTAGASPEIWRFAGHNMRRARVALRLTQDLGVNIAGAALALQLMEEIETLRSRLRVMGIDLDQADT
ncbi:MAG: chaperone modulator CbpM [Burkholderiales bacterium]